MTTPFPTDLTQQDKDRFFRNVNVNGAVPSHMQHLGHCWTKGTSASNYPLFRLNGKYFPSNRISWIIYNGEIPEGMLVCHKCDNKLCVNPSHLFLGTYSDNINDALQKGINVPRSGEQHRSAKLDVEKVRTIRRLHSEGMSRGALSRKFGMGGTTILKVIRRQTWKHVL